MNRHLVPPLTRAVWPLLWKEVRQTLRNRGALASATILPFILLIAVPVAQLAAFSAGSQAAALTTANLPPNASIDQFDEPLDIYRQLLLPLFVSLSGLLVPMIAASYTVVAERERRSLDLLMALPVSVMDVLAAKVLSVLAMAVVVVVPLFVVLVTILLAQGVVTLGFTFTLFLLLLAGFICSIGFTTVVTLLARDFRTANNLSGLQIGPLIFGLLGLLLALPYPGNLLVAALLLLVLGAGALLIAWRWITFERYLA